MDLGGASWAIINIGGPLLLAAVLLWVFLRNRKEGPEPGRTEEATRQAYDEEEAARRDEDGDG